MWSHRRRWRGVGGGIGAIAMPARPPAGARWRRSWARIPSLPGPAGRSTTPRRCGVGGGHTTPPDSTRRRSRRGTPASARQWSRRRTCASSWARTARNSSLVRSSRIHAGTNTRTFPPVHHTIGVTRASVVRTSGTRARPSQRPMAAASCWICGDARLDAPARRRRKRAVRTSDHPSRPIVPRSHAIARPEPARAPGPSLRDGPEVASANTTSAEPEASAKTVPAGSAGSTGSETTVGTNRINSTASQSL